MITMYACFCRLTAYARRSPFGSEDNWVGWPRVVDGEGAQVDSTTIEHIAPLETLNEL